MAATLYRDARYANVWLVGAGGTITVSGELMASLQARGVPFVTGGPHDPSLKSLLATSGLTVADLVPA